MSYIDDASVKNIVIKHLRFYVSKVVPEYSERPKIMSRHE